MEQFHFVKEFHNQTTIHPVGVVALALAVLAVLLVPRNYALVPIIVIACLIAPAQRVVIMGLDFSFIRIVTLAAWLRIFVHGEYVRFHFTTIDKLFIAWVSVTTGTALLLYPSVASLTYQLGVAFDAITTFFIMRLMVRDRADLVGLARGAALLALPVAGAMAHERLSGANFFSFFGGVPEETLERFGRFRAQAAFAHPIVAGVFWASLVPLMLVGIRRSAEDAVIGTLGVVAGCVIVWCCSSSTPVLLIAFVAMAYALFPIRRVVPWLRWGVAATLVMLHIAMFPPVWHLFARINFFPGSTGWWRYLIIDKFVNHWDEWIFVGTTTSERWIDGGMFVDVTNQYVLEGINGGIVKLALFIAIIVFGFKAIGRVIRHEESRRSSVRATMASRTIVTTNAPSDDATQDASAEPSANPSVDPSPDRLANPVMHPRRRRAGDELEPTWMVWCIGTSLAVHAAAYFATAYFGQLVLIQYMSLGIAASMPAVFGVGLSRRRRTVQAVRGVNEAASEVAASGTNEESRASRPEWCRGEGGGGPEGDGFGHGVFRPV
ncbi:MAG: hypothetical protein AB8G96_01720 [Phycisphaerales bacterium]